MSKIGRPYKGKLSASQVTQGINLASANARRLLQDAELLFEAERYPTSAALAVLAIEEAGKIGVLRGILSSTTTDQLQAAWRDYRSHTSKNILWVAPHMITSGKSRKLIDFAGLSSPTSEHTGVLERVKQLSLYTDCLGNAEWSDPLQSADKQVAETVLFSARALANGETFTEREIELWLQAMNEHSEPTIDAAQQALVHWYASMQAEGLAPSGENKMLTFIGPRIGDDEP